MSRRLVASEIRNDLDVVAARQKARDLARLVGFDRQDQTRIATAVSEVARNAFEYGHGGIIEYFLTEGKPSKLTIRMRDRGPGISHLKEVLSGEYQSPTGLGLGIIGAKRLMDEFRIETDENEGTEVVLTKFVPTHLKLLTPQRIQAIGDELSHSVIEAPIKEFQEQNQEIIRAMEDLGEKQEELVQLNRELEDTNRGVVALYGELDEKAEALKKANEMKTRFLSNITHEFRTPLGATINLTEMLLAGLEGPLNENQIKTLRLIQKSNEGLLEMVNDLLDLAKVEAGRISIRPVEFELKDLFASLRGLLRPLADRNPSVSLEFLDLTEPLKIFGDEAKIAQVARNLISNAIKYTESGTVKVLAQVLNPDRFIISVSDTGIGIANNQLERIFEEFVQLESSLQKKYKGSGIGLSLTRRLVALLGGEIRVESTLGVGSKFSVKFPIRYEGEAEGDYLSLKTSNSFSEVQVAEGRTRVLIIDDEIGERYFLRSILVSKFHCEVLEASSGEEGLAMMANVQPSIVFLDLNMGEMDGYTVFQKMKSSERFREIPVVIHSGKTFNEVDRERLQTAVAFLSKIQDSEEQLLNKISQVFKELSLNQGG